MFVKVVTFWGKFHYLQFWTIKDRLRKAGEVMRWPFVVFQGHWVAGIQRGQQSGAVLTQQHGGHPRQLPVLQVGFHTPAGSCLLIMESSQCNEDKHIN